MTTIGEFDLRHNNDLSVNEGLLSAKGAEIVLTLDSGGTLREWFLDLNRSDYAVYWTDGKTLLS